ncbi:MAG: hypothetical protein GAK28_04926 [Luteibacter sp.]|uniref:phage scaffolding protein n=1 Tax=Luteibacter sp. TaxID=1886636 RepID=UPI001385D5F6|nr:hypothetical protein [Luteibacter sp.]KAF1003125.1 MAG: hypothetical protein GAK28_04926 [Luteibacter sp.]
MIRFGRKRRRLMEGEGGGEGGGGAGGPAAPQNPPSRSNESFSREYVQELRAESSGYRLKAKEQQDAREAAEKRAKEAEDAASARIAEATSAADQRIIRAELKAVAIKAGIVDLDGLKLVDLSKVKLNEQGEVEGADALIEELKTAKPYLFGAAGSSSVSTPPANTPPAQKKASDMTPEEYAAARREAIRRR